ncbi:hypothetical protein BKA63DRAFT_485757 [Paraphoma chrysanthemicola]|nr:hypothetical protein BKA63DRAFT_485757 [Paraphoma chrysanthemicola]
MHVNATMIGSRELSLAHTEQNATHIYQNFLRVVQRYSTPPHCKRSHGLYIRSRDFRSQSAILPILGNYSGTLSVPSLMGAFIFKGLFPNGWAGKGKELFWAGGLPETWAGRNEATLNRNACVGWSPAMRLDASHLEVVFALPDAACAMGKTALLSVFDQVGWSMRRSRGFICSPLGSIVHEAACRFINCPVAQWIPARQPQRSVKVGTDEYRSAYLLAAHWTKQTMGQGKIEMALQSRPRSPSPQVD